MRSLSKFSTNLSRKTKTIIFTAILILLSISIYLHWTFPPVIIKKPLLEEKWTHESIEYFKHYAEIYSRPVIGDINSDGYHDIVAIICKDPEYYMIVAVDGFTGKILWNYNLSMISSREVSYKIFSR